jgi:alpha-L-fucosidase 2
MDDSTLQVRGTAGTPGLLYELLFKAYSTGGSISCAEATPEPGAGSNATLTVTGANAAWIAWVGETEYDMYKGNAAANFSFQGPDPHAANVANLEKTTAPYSVLRAQHLEDFASALGPFALSLGPIPDLNCLPTTSEAMANYQVDVGNSWIEWVVFNYARYMLASSSRGVLPANLQGKWANGSSNPWSGDYHPNINLQMNYWSAEMTGLDVTEPVFNYIEQTWTGRGAQTALTLYNISQGFVLHDESNIYGQTGMKDGADNAEWSNYPESNVWMMIHVWDHFAYTQDVEWWKSQGYPLIKQVASFHIQKLVPDEHFNDSTLVTVPCNSPAQPAITFGCAHQQQIIWQLFNAVLKGYKAAGETDKEFVNDVANAVSKMDKGVRIGSWGQLQEWKVDMDSPTDTHRHLSHLIGLYPGYAVTSYEPSLQGVPILESPKKSENYTRAQVLQAAEISLIHRGNGTGTDADSGWEKAWRAACWAQLANATEFFHELSVSFLA